MTTLFAAVHHLAVLTLLVCTLLTIRQLMQPFTVAGARLLSKTDMVNGIAATLVLVVGLVRVFYFEKGSAYYFHNAPFLLKMGFYGLASVLSVIPTLEIYRWRAPLKSGLLPTLSVEKLSTLRTVAVLQLACLTAMAACANLAARGIDWNVFGD
jgi:putative membrane protein